MSKANTMDDLWKILNQLIDDIVNIQSDSQGNVWYIKPHLKAHALITAKLQEVDRAARIDELKKVGCCDYWEEGCSLNVCNGEQLTRILELEALSDKHSSKGDV